MKFGPPTTPTREQLIDDLLRAAPPGQDELDPRVAQQLRSTTIELGHYWGHRAVDAFNRFAATTYRELSAPDLSSLSALQGQTILVTGGSGCIGEALLNELTKLRPERLVSVARGITPLARPVRGVEYRKGDIRSANTLDRLLADVRPSVVFHLAAQRDPELAEHEIVKTISTNVFGTQRLLTAARRHGVNLFVYASTGKAMRFYSADVYAATKKAGEWLVSRAGNEEGMTCAAVRFTHVVNHSMIRRKMVDWGFQGAPIRLHGSHVGFYLQSARESAQLLISAALEAEEGATAVNAIRNLGEPMDLLDLALGTGLAMERIAPIYICGFEAGYEAQPHPALYDPQLSLEFTPLFNGLEAGGGEASGLCPEIDRVTIAVEEAEGQLESLEMLEISCLDSHRGEAKAALNSLSWELLAGRLKCSPVEARQRTLKRSLSAVTGLNLPYDHLRTNEVLAASLEPQGTTA